MSATLATNGTATAVSLAQAGQQARVTFSWHGGTRSDAVCIERRDDGADVSELSDQSPGRHLPDSGYCYPSGNGCALAPYALPATGTYEIVFTPYPSATSGSFNVQAWESSRVTGTLTVGTANTYTSTIAGQVVQKTFSGTAGQQRGLTLSGFTTSVSGATLNVIVFKPDGTQLTNNNFTAAQTSPTAFVVDLPVLPTTGSYTVQVLPYGRAPTTS